MLLELLGAVLQTLSVGVLGRLLLLLLCDLYAINCHQIFLILSAMPLYLG